ncbi:hypothetical protein JCGZ_21268 [Jatropha curcas]|uniref:Ubiquitin-like domain-containing protein n=1 Tax=Jatropha curcas TaxID=180498 RepID=A0A067JAK8_JATCU|nr:uncharacterized protein LOC105649387 [Jatropha curcas]KDP20797.1 hypothetical protein JCGZ_21268 [Jatropha curcas]
MVFWVEYRSTRYPVDPPDPTIFDIKVAIAHMHHDVGVWNQKIFHRGVEMDNDAIRAEDYGIRDNDEIFLSVRRDYYFQANDVKHFSTIWDHQTILEVKNEIRIMTGIPAEKMELSYIGNTLQDNQKLASYKIPNTATIDAFEMYDLEVMGYNGIYKLKVHKRMTIGQVKYKLHVEYGLDHTTMRLERAYSKGFFRDYERLSAHKYLVMMAVGGGA